MPAPRRGASIGSMTRTQPLEPAARSDGPYGPRERLLATMPVSERRLRIAGVSTAVLEGGDGPPVVLLHGPGEFAATWTRVIPSLVTTNRVVAPDLPGHGASSPATRVDVETLRGWLDALVRQTCDAPPVIVGHLLGGSLAARYAAGPGAMVAGLVLVDSYGLARLRPSPRFAAALARFLVRPTPRTQRSLMLVCLADRDGLSNETDGRLDTMEAYALELARAPGARSVVRRTMAALGTPVIPAAELARIAVPTTLIWGSQDLQVRPRVAQAASARHGWPLHLIEGSAGDPAIEQPRAFLQALRTALADHEEA
jgi:pimeloyl-ACP methyl ester carboxylesterase